MVTSLLKLNILNINLIRYTISQYNAKRVFLYHCCSIVVS